MSEFDRENEPFFQEIHRNHRRSNATQVVGYFVPQKEAQRKWLGTLSRRRKRGEWRSKGRSEARLTGLAC